MTRIWVFLSGAIGLAIALRAAGYYSGVDRFAFTITIVMVLALCAGIFELLLRAKSVGQLDEDLKKAVKKAADAAKEGTPLANLDGTTPQLRAVLRSHLERDPMPTRAPLFTPYLVGLLVMLGLLGTFLGLFETLRGAREALSTSGDVDALRAGLSTPMAGLMRSFGTSAAGVASSAMLGLGAVFVRRSARAFDQAVHRACAEGLSHLSAARRQLTALIALAEQGESLPSAARALAAATRELARLRETSAESHASDRKALEDVGDRLGEALGETAATLEKQFVSLDASLRSNQEAHIEAMRRDELASRDAREAQQKQALDSFEKSGEALRRGLEETSTSINAGLQATNASINVGLRKTGALVEEGMSNASEAMRAGFTNWIASFDEADSARRGEFAEQMSELLARLDALESAWRRGHERAAEQVRNVMISGIAEASKVAGESVEPTVARVVEATERSAAAHLEELRRQFESDAAIRRGRDEKAARALAEHASSVERVFEKARSERAEKDTAIHARFDAHIASTIARMDEAVSTRAEADAERTTEFVARLAAFEETTQSRAEAFSNAIASATDRWRQELEAARQRDGERAVSLLETSERVEARLGGATTMLAERIEAQANIVAASDARTEQLLERLAQVVTNIDTHSRTQQRATEALLARQDERSAELEQTATSRLEALMDAIGEASNQQAARIAAFETSLAERQETGAERLRGQLGEEARQLGEGLDRAAEMVREAASLVQVGGAELSAAVELFGGSVQLHGEAAQRWLTGLSVVERSVEEAGEGAAVEVLGEYLTRTHELFDQQLGFQQELLEQLRLTGSTQADA